jgi:hypothetical protein
MLHPIGGLFAAKRSQVDQMCDTWHYERDVNTPPNLYSAQYERRTKGAIAPPPA